LDNKKGNANFRQQSLHFYFYYCCSRQKNQAIIVGGNREMRVQYDPKGLCKDVTNLGRWGNGDVEDGLSSAAQLEDVMYLIAQSFEKNVDNESH
jgi:predicted transport protein